MDKIVFDFQKARQLKEMYIKTFGITLKDLMTRMFGGEKVPLIVKGTPKEVKAFAKALRMALTLDERQQGVIPSTKVRCK